VKTHKAKNDQHLPHRTSRGITDASEW